MKIEKFPQGSAIVEFVLVFPLLFLLVLAFFDLSLLLIRQLSLEEATRVLARRLALSNTMHLSQLRTEADQWLNVRYKVNTPFSLRLRTLPSAPPMEPLRQKKSVQIMELTTEQMYELGPFPLKLKSHVREMRTVPN